MAQDRQKEDLKKLLQFLDTQILRNPDNNWFAKDLFKILAPASDARICDIYEQCIEQILSQQAEDFYKDFPFDEIKGQLIADFIKMEHWQRRDNLQEFCMALYQQIEGIVNYLCKQDAYKIVWRNIRDAKFFVDLEAKDIRTRWDKCSKSIKQSVIYKSENYEKELSDLPAMDKFKAILFLVVYGTYVDSNNITQYNADFHMGNDIYRLRNMNHRGSKGTEYQSERIEAAFDNRTHTMMTYLGYYSRFVAEVIKGAFLNKNIIEFAENCYKEKNLSNEEH